MRPRITYANVVSTLCLFLLLGGTAWAVAANSIGTKQLKDGAVTTPKLRDRAVTDAKLGAVGDVRPAPFGDSGWTDAGQGYAPAGYFKDRSGLIHLGGSVTGSGPVIFRLPRGWRPTGGARRFGHVTIRGDGRVQPDGGAELLSLDGIVFRP
ncbi:MAG TPA: hypothetical protein VJT75_19440 [Thermoleophilaceae bacterium]|nr:hypothetical protein [Thermoleophilaceae bacterium]